jgi:hypothetical protein
MIAIQTHPAIDSLEERMQSHAMMGLVAFIES